MEDADMLAKRKILACEKAGLLLRQRIPSHQCKATSRCYIQCIFKMLIVNRSSV